MPTAVNTTPLLARSRAFRDAVLRAEVGRASAVLAIVGLILLPTALLAASHPVAPTLLIVGAIAGLLLVAVQIATLVAARRARRLDHPLPTWISVAGVVVECSVPTIAILAHVRLHTVAPHVALTTPPILAYALLIALTTLRLRPWLCILGGVIAAGTYLSLVWHVSSTHGLPNHDHAWPRVGYAMAPVLIAASALASAWIAHQFRRHVEAALDEADMRRKVDRLEHDIGIARAIQQALLPHASPEIPGYEIAAWNRPADQTGGDYYDWHQLPDGKWLISLADVSGHGIGPALVTAACRAYVRASAVQHADLAALAAHVNQLLAADLPSGRFVTMANVLIDTAATGRSIALLSAGHGPMVMYLKSAHEVRDLLPHDPPLAVVPDSGFGPPQALQLEPGDLLALVTDGFVEWARARTDQSAPREQFGVHRFHESLRKHAHLPLPEVIERLTADVAAFAAGEPQQDDLTIVLIRRTD